MEHYGKLLDYIEKMKVLNFVGLSGSITKAATQLHITQAAASHSIRVLEEALNVKLLRREALGISLTDSGKILFEFSQRLLVDIQSAEAMTLNPYHQDTQPNIDQSTEVSALFETVVNQYGHIDVVINNASVNTSKPITISETSDDEFDRILNTNTKGSFYVMREAPKPRRRVGQWPSHQR